MEKISGYATLTFAILMVLIGLTMQILKNRKERRCGTAFFLAILTVCVYSCRAWHALTINDFYILIPDTIGIVLSGIILGQFFYYRKTREI